MNRLASVPIRGQGAGLNGVKVVVGTSLAILLVAGSSAITSGEGIRYPAAIAAVITFALVPLVIPAARIDTRRLLSPKNWAVFVFAIPLLAMPLLLQLYGPEQGSLRVTPAPESIDTAFLIMSSAYIAFAIGLSLGLKIQVNRRVLSSVAHVASTFGPHPIVIMILVALGVVGLALRFGSAASVVDYFRFGSNQLIPTSTAALTGSASVGQAASSFLLPCLGMGFAMLWCRLIEVRRSANRLMIPLLVKLGLTTILIPFSFSLFQYNRSAIVAPIVALAAAFSRHVRRIPMTVLVPSAASLLVAMLWLGSLRTTYYTTRTDPYSVAQASLASVDPNKEIQIYGSGPQFLGYMIEVSQLDGRLYMGGTLVPSMMAPVPVIGQSFRPFSGPVLYNYELYGFYGVTDQIIPLDGELYWNFRLPGVVAGFLLLGIVVAVLQRRFAARASPWASFVVMYTAVWTTFLIVGSLSVVAQIALYFGWPLLFLSAIGWWRQSNASAYGDSPGSGTHNSVQRLTEH